MSLLSKSMQYTVVSMGNKKSTYTTVPALLDSELEQTRVQLVPALLCWKIQIFSQYVLLLTK